MCAQDASIDMCQAIHLITGVRYHLTTTSGAKCLCCSAEVFYDGPAIYKGHSDDGLSHIFQIIDLWLCPGCGATIDEYYEPCHDYGELVEIPVYELKFNPVEV